MTVPSPRASVAALPAYKPGKSAEVAMAEHSLASAIKLASNENPFDPLPSVRAVIDGASAAMNRYPDHGALALRAALASHNRIDVERVTVGCGSVGLLQQLVLTYVDPGDHVVYGWRSFEVYPIYVGMVAGVSVQVPNVRETLDMGSIVAAIDERTRLVMVTSPNNPTGSAVSHDELVAVLDAVPPQCLVVLDEAYYEYATGAHLPRSRELLDRYGNLAVLRTFSKAYGLAALRVGYLMADAEVISAVDRTLVPFAVNGLGQAAAMASLAAGDELLERVRQTLAERDRVEAALIARGLVMPDAEANFVWLPAGDASAELTVGLESMGVVTRPFAGEGVRVTIGSVEENDRFLDAFDTVAAKLDLHSAWRL